METKKLNKSILVDEMGYKEYQPLRNYINSSLIRKTQLYQKKSDTNNYQINVIKVTMHDMEENGKVKDEYFEFNVRLLFDHSTLNRALKLDSTGYTDDDLKKFESLVEKVFSIK